MEAAVVAPPAANTAVGPLAANTAGKSIFAIYAIYLKNGHVSNIEMAAAVDPQIALMPAAVRVYVDGVYDLFHYGHAEMLGRVRAKFGPAATIIAGVARDEDCLIHKRLPILTQDERARSVRACKYVDEVIEDAPWVITQEFLDAYGIDIVCHDGASYPSTADGGTHDIYEYVKSIGRFIHIDRTPSISTSELIERIHNRRE